MTDPMDPTTILEPLREGPDDLRPAPAAAVRSRGDRLRRRRHALVAGGAALAVVLVAAPLTGLGTGGERSAPPPAEQPTRTSSTGSTPDASSGPEPRAAPTTLPDDFPLAAGWPEPGSEEERLTGPGPRAIDVEYRACGEVLGLPGEPAASHSAQLLIGSEVRTREVALYESPEAAAAASSALRAFFEGCPRDEDTGIPPALLTSVTDAPAGTAGWLAERGYDEPFAVGRSVVVVRPAGNGLLVEQRSDEGTGALGRLAREASTSLGRPHEALVALVARGDDG